MAVLKMIAGADAEVTYVDLQEALGEALQMRNYFAREAQEAEALLAHVTARIQKRKATVAKYDTRLLELRIKAHMLGIDRDLGKELMGET